MQVHYLEIVTTGVDAVCAGYAAANGLTFGARPGGSQPGADERVTVDLAGPDLPLAR